MSILFTPLWSDPAASPGRIIYSGIHLPFRRACLNCLIKIKNNFMHFSLPEKSDIRLFLLPFSPCPRTAEHSAAPDARVREETKSYRNRFIPHLRRRGGETRVYVFFRWAPLSTTGAK
jgi:hypothetical protein